jgi:RNA polymerase sigma factor (sigma-70 family)
MKEITDNELREALKNRDNINVMNKICSKYTEIIPYEELKRCKLISLWEALKAYDPSKGKCKFTSFLCNRLFWEIQKQLYEINKIKRLPKSDSASIFISEICHSKESPDGTSSIKLEVDEMLEKLDEDSKDILFKRFYESKTAKEIGHDNGYGRETARRRIKDALEKLKQCSQN